MTTALLLINVQRNLLDGESPIPGADSVAPALRSLLDHARAAGAPTVHVHDDDPAGQPDAPHPHRWEPAFRVLPWEPVVRTCEPDAFSGTRLAAILQELGVHRVVVAGLRSEDRIAPTGHGALRRGLDVVVASGAHAARDRTGGDAAAIEGRTEDDLSAAGAKIIDAGTIHFDCSP
ncbi:isochorismatase family protein [Nocardiopsis sediminis]|uniref:Isochorismatase family protein n=1 Tax=Nocardiopsis sediminis TaxID=1778267 RepID=A0ABV8FHY3_9ACTN